MMLESQSAINPHHKLRPIKPDQPLIAWIKFITPSSFFGPSLEYSVLELAQISWISPLSASLIFLDHALVIGLIETCNGSFNACWFLSTYTYCCNKDGLITHLRNNNKQKLPDLSLKILKLIMSSQQTIQDQLHVFFTIEIIFSVTFLSDVVREFIDVTNSKDKWSPL